MVDWDQENILLKRSNGQLRSQIDKTHPAVQPGQERLAAGNSGDYLGGLTM